MYIIINKTQDTCVKETGKFPATELEKLLDKGERIVIINMYDNNVLVPRSVQLKNGKDGWDWEEYAFPDGVFRGL
jgi:hypothetical protein